MGNSLKSLFNFALQKGELGARVARLRLEIAGLTRSREAAFARLGRGYHANPSLTADLEPLLREVDRIALEIRDRESVLAQLLQPKAPEPLPAPALESGESQGDHGLPKSQSDDESPKSQSSDLTR